MDFESTSDNNNKNSSNSNSNSNDNNNDNDDGRKLPPSVSISTEYTPINTYTSAKIPFKPALKPASSMDDDDDDDGNDEDNGGRHSSFATKKKAGFATKKTSAKKKNRTLKWDEAKIQEHDQLRGTRMKIDEPNTPFNYYDSGSETDCSMNSARGNRSVDSASSGKNSKISWDALTNKLEAHAAVANLYPPSSPSSHGGGDKDIHYYTTDEEDETQKRERQRRELKKLEFQEHRKRHYNEMEAVRRFRRENPESSDGEPMTNGRHSVSSSVTHSGNNTTDDEDNDGDDENDE